MAPSLTIPPALAVVEGCQIHHAHESTQYDLARLVAPGDVLFVKGSGGIAEIGTTGGFLGHFLVVLSYPQKCSCWEKQNLLPAQLGRDNAHVWKVDTLESTRSHNGLHQAQMLIHAQKNTGRLVLVGELASGGSEFVDFEHEAVQMWQSPREIRSSLRKQVINEVIQEMKSCEKSWSLATAARAVLLPATFSPRKSRMRLQELVDCWTRAPICTSVVVVFWQRLLCKLAPDSTKAPMDLILKYIPLKADRGLPGELIRTMAECGWHQHDHLLCSL